MRVFARYRHELCAAYQAFAGLLAGPEELLRMGQLERSRELSLQHARLGTHLEAPVAEEGHGGRNSAKPPPAAPAAEVPAPAPAPAPAPIDLTAEGGVEAAEAAAEAEKEAAAAVAKAEAEAKAAAKDAAAPASCPLLSSHEFVLMLRWAGLLEVDLHGEEEEKVEEEEGEGEDHEGEGEEVLDEDGEPSKAGQKDGKGPLRAGVVLREFMLGTRCALDGDALRLELQALRAAELPDVCDGMCETLPLPPPLEAAGHEAVAAAVAAAAAAEAAVAAEEAEKAEKAAASSALNSLANSPVKALMEAEEATTPSPSRNSLALFGKAGSRVMSGPRMGSVVDEARAAQAVAEARVLAAVEGVEREGHRGFGVTRRWRATYDDFLECLARCAATQMGGGSELGSGVGRLCEAITESVRKGPDHLPVPEAASLGPHLALQQARLQLKLSMAAPRLVSTNKEGGREVAPEEVAPTPPTGRPGSGAPARRPGSARPGSAAKMINPFAKGR